VRRHSPAVAGREDRAGGESLRHRPTPFALSLDSALQLEAAVTYVVTEACIRCKYTDCVEVCPVDCFYEGATMLAINPDECIDCGVCEPECPAEAIKPDTSPGLEAWLAINDRMARVWPNLTTKKPPPPDADAWLHRAGKLDEIAHELPAGLLPTAPST
jgi:ferredoxin